MEGNGWVEWIKGATEEIRLEHPAEKRYPDRKEGIRCRRIEKVGESECLSDLLRKKVKSAGTDFHNQINYYELFG